VTAVAPVEFPMPWGGVVRGQRWGEGAAVALLLHAPGEDLDAWGDLPGELLADGFSVVAVDLPGHGLSDGPWRPERLGETVAAVAERLRIACGRPVLVVAAGASGLAAVRAGAEGGIAAVVALVGAEDEGPVGRVERAPPTLIVVGAAAGGALERAKALFRDARGYAVLSAMPTAETGVRLLAGAWGRQAREQTVAFLRDYRLGVRRGAARSAQ
jgi:pimeloyl-ACP methyl ester carboxylesterase